MALAEDLAFRGLIHQVTDEGLLGRLDTESLTVYGGFDPTADSLGVGNLMQLCTLKRFQEAGHRPIALAGGGTGGIGDPGGRADERPLLEREELEANVAAVRAQLGRFLDFEGGPGRPPALVVDNGDWLWSLGLLDFLRDVGKHFTIGQMTAKESVRTRLETRGKGISYAEFSYMLLQAYDFLRLYDEHGCRLQIGGSDQWGNITMGVDLVRRVRGAEVWGMTSPLVLKADGTKFGKSAEGNVWLDARRSSPYQLYQFLVRSEDSVVGSYLRYYTWLERERIEELDKVTAEHPERREAQRVLAREVTALVHGAEEAHKAERAARALFGEELQGIGEDVLLEVFADAPSSTIARERVLGGDLTLSRALVETGLEPSISSARRTVSQGGAYVNNRREDDPERVIGQGDLLCGRYVVLRRGRHHHHLLMTA